MIVPAWVPPLPRRGLDDHKGTAGKVGVLGGSPGLTGAVTLASRAALRSGAGLVTAGVPGALAPFVDAATPEVMVRALGAGDHLDFDAIASTEPFLETVDAIAVGPGLGREATTTEWLGVILNGSRTGVLDADGLWHLAVAGRRLGSRLSRGLGDGRWVLTPHEGELDRLLGTFGDRELEATPPRTPETVLDLAHRLDCVIVAKGRGTIVADPDGNHVVNPSGNPGLATGGTGDVLAGMIAAGLARGEEPFRAACRAVWLHGRAADYAAYGEAAALQPGRPSESNEEIDSYGIGEESLIASDVIATLPLALRELQREKPA